MLKYFISIACVFSMATAFATKEEFGRIPAKEVQTNLTQGSILVFDVNAPKIYAENHVPGAKNIPMDVTEKELPQDKSANLVFYCMNEQCTASHSAAKKAKQLGYKNVFVMPDGIQGWKKAGYKIEKI